MLTGSAEDVVTQAILIICVSENEPAKCLAECNIDIEFRDSQEPVLN